MIAPEIEIIIPTTASTARSESICVAVKSVVEQNQGEARALVVVNGQNSDPDVIDWLKAQENVECYFEEQASAPNACLVGRRHVIAPFFGFLDDDDRLCPGALSNRAAELRRSKNLDVVVANGWREISGVKQSVIKDVEACQEDPLSYLFIQNWLASCAALFRSEVFPAAFFEDYEDFAEWTYMAYRLSSRFDIRFLSECDYVLHSTPGSLSSSEDYRLGELRTSNRILESLEDSRLRRIVQRKKIDQLHDISSWYNERGQRRLAWKYHLRSLASPYGWKYISYTRRLFLRVSSAA